MRQEETQAVRNVDGHHVIFIKRLNLDLYGYVFFSFWEL